MPEVTIHSIIVGINCVTCVQMPRLSAKVLHGLMPQEHSHNMHGGGHFAHFLAAGSPKNLL